MEKQKIIVKKYFIFVVLLGLVFISVNLSFFVIGQSAIVTAEIKPLSSSDQSAYNEVHITDPFAYCVAVGTVDTPDTRYTGPTLPQTIVRGLIRIGLVSADSPKEFIQNAVWRCMDGKVLACFIGANIPCMEKADTNRKPSSEMFDFCKTNPNSDFIPAYITGRATVYEWGCRNGSPVIVKELFKPDARGFLSDFWYEINPE